MIINEAVRRQQQVATYMIRKRKLNSKLLYIRDKRSWTWNKSSARIRNSFLQAGYLSNAIGD